MKNKIVMLLILLGASFLTNAAEPRIEASKAAFHVGETVMACGTVAQVSKGKKAHYLNLDNRYPNQTLAVLIWNNNLKGFEQRFGQITQFENQRVCARGKITEYKNSLQIQVSNPQFLRLMK
ncbi:hypothetical protein ACP43V_16050 [Vibrio genomosp. F10 str. 9ZC157]|uniref:hypothetical protein n=1 Tax=Vibrio genomosp. F10 TaxID=723171 RepID=UPI000364E3B6|nr:hypothetical protein [Vibrio genomosp. F10]OEE93468.1 hypothetical protein A1QM_09290 [Vibrio genomosp. F10 str. 9ZC157]